MNDSVNRKFIMIKIIIYNTVSPIFYVSFFVPCLVHHNAIMYSYTTLIKF